MNRLVSLLALLMLNTSGASALGDAPDPRTIIAKADQAARAVRAIAYTAEVRGEGALQNQPQVRASVLAQTATTGPYPSLRIDGTVQIPGSANVHAFHYVLNDKQVMSRDDERKVATVGELPRDFEIVENAMRGLVVAELLHPSPFADALAGSSLKYEGEQTVSDTMCHVIHVRYADGHDLRWYFGEGDFLPRRMDRVHQLPGGEGSIVLQLSELDPAPQVDADTFAIVVPEGYERKKPLRLPPSDPRLLPVGSAAPDWTLKSAEGQTVKLSALRGKVIVLDFWATWCGWCIKAMPSMQKLYTRFKDKPVEILAVNTMERSKRVNPVTFMRSRGFTYGLLLDDKNKVAQAYRITGLPTLYVIDPEGKVAHTLSGLPPGGEEGLGELIEQLVAAAAD